jgi:hypothetical protein
MILVRWRRRSSVWVRRVHETVWTEREYTGAACCEQVSEGAELRHQAEYLARVAEALTPPEWIERLRANRAKSVRSVRPRRHGFRRPRFRRRTKGGKRP